MSPFRSSKREFYFRICDFRLKSLGHPSTHTHRLTPDSNRFIYISFVAHVHVVVAVAAVVVYRLRSCVRSDTTTTSCEIIDHRAHAPRFTRFRLLEGKHKERKMSFFILEK